MRYPDALLYCEESSLPMCPSYLALPLEAVIIWELGLVEEEGLYRINGRANETGHYFDGNGNPSVFPGPNWTQNATLVSIIATTSH